MPKFKRPRHRLVWRVLESLNCELLTSTQCYFGGGTRIVLELGEFRESFDIDFLCSNRAGYRTLRSMITQSSFGELFSGSYDLIREIRADMYGIRTFLLVEDQPLKFEIISEGRIHITGARTKPFPVQVLDRPSCFAEKLLANADRGGDESTRSRDVIDLAFMTSSWSNSDLMTGLTKATEIYGDAVHRGLATALTLIEDQKYRNQCATELSLSDPRKLGRGLRALRKLA